MSEECDSCEIAMLECTNCSDAFCTQCSNSPSEFCCEPLCSACYPEAETCADCNDTEGCMLCLTSNCFFCQNFSTTVHNLCDDCEIECVACQKVLCAAHARYIGEPTEADASGGEGYICVACAAKALRGLTRAATAAKTQLVRGTVSVGSLPVNGPER